eukprot:2728254-Pyramimonas_sp.AAC.1
MIRSEVLPDPFGPISFLLGKWLVASFSQTFFRRAIGRIHTAAQAVTMGPGPRGSSEVRAP